jgi:ankyrin repeat protein
MIAAVAGGDDFCPLHYACCSNSSTENLLEAVDFLLQADPDGIHAGSSEGELPLHVACKHGKPLELIERLFEQSPVTVKAMDNNGLLPLDAACQNPASELSVIFFLVTKDPGQLLRVKK